MVLALPTNALDINALNIIPLNIDNNKENL